MEVTPDSEPSTEHYSTVPQPNPGWMYLISSKPRRIKRKLCPLRPTRLQHGALDGLQARFKEKQPASDITWSRGLGSSVWPNYKASSIGPRRVKVDPIPCSYDFPSPAPRTAPPVDDGGPPWMAFASHQNPEASPASSGEASVKPNRSLVQRKPERLPPPSSS